MSSKCHVAFGLALVLGSVPVGAAPPAVEPVRFDLAAMEPAAPVAGPALGPDPAATPDPARYRSFGAQVGTVKWELAGFAAYMTALNVAKNYGKDHRGFHFKDEGWFGKNTQNVGVDKLTHAFNTYVISDVLHAAMARRTGGAPGTAVTAAALASGLMIYSELYDAHKTDGGWSWEDIASNTAGAAFSIARNTVPGLKEKLDFRLLLIPTSTIYTPSGRKHYQQQRYLLALTLAGFERLERSPLRFVELHVGYYAKDFGDDDRAAGIVPRRILFAGVGVNLKELFFKSPRSRAGRAAGSALDYLQLPYTALHVH